MMPGMQCSHITIKEGDPDALEYMQEYGGFVLWDEGNDVQFAPLNLVLEVAPWMDDDIEVNGEILASVSMKEDEEPVAVLVIVDSIPDCYAAPPNENDKDLLLIPVKNCSNVKFPIDYREQQEVTVVMKRNRFFARGGDGGMKW